VEFDNYITEASLRAARRLLLEPDLAEEWATTNFELGRRHFSFDVLDLRLGDLLAECFAGPA
jgi:hypothetical protein